MAVQIRFITGTIAAPEYNCSAHTPQDWTEQFGTRQTVLGIWSITFATVCQMLYLPSLRVFFRERKSTCFKIMYFLAMADMAGLTCTGTLFGYAMLRGMVFCSDVELASIMGCGAYCFWSVSTCTCAMLVINRICELTERSRLFQGWRSSVCMAIALLYGVTGPLFTRPVFPNSVYQTMAFDPFIPGHTVDEYPNLANMIHNFCVSFFIPSLYIVLCAIVRKNSHRFKDSTATQALQAKIFTQASIICCGNVGTAAAWLIQMFVPTPQFVITAGMITVQSMHGIFCVFFCGVRNPKPSSLHFTHFFNLSGLPCFIYLVLNRTVRDEMLKMLGRNPHKIAAGSAFTMSSASAAHS